MQEEQVAPLLIHDRLSRRARPGRESLRLAGEAWSGSGHHHEQVIDERSEGNKSTRETPSLSPSLHPGGIESNIRGTNLASINDWLFFVHAAMTLFMVGAIRFVQIVHYPLFTTSARRVIHAPGSIVPRTSAFARSLGRVLLFLRATPQDTRCQLNGKRFRGKTDSDLITPMSASEKKVLIVGGGLAGLACAIRLHQSGARPLIFEGSDGVGGRVRTDEVDGFLLDRGFQVFLDAYPEAGALLDMDKLDLRAFRPGALIYQTSGMRRIMDVLREPRHLIESALAPVGSLADKLRVARLRWRLMRLSTEEIAGHEDMTTESYLKHAGFSPAMIDGFFRSFYGGIFLERELQTSSRMFEFTFKMFSQGSATLPSRGMGKFRASWLPPPSGERFASAHRSRKSGREASPLNPASNFRAMPWSWPPMRRPRQDWYLLERLPGPSGGQ